MGYPPRTRIYLAGSETFGGQRVFIPLRPLPPPPERPIYRHEKEGWYGWIGEKGSEPDPTPKNPRDQAHRLLSDALDYIVSVEADAFFPGLDNDGSGLPDFSSLVMGHRLFKTASSRTYRPDKRYITKLINTTSNHLYHPPRNWTLTAREHLNKSLSEDGILQESKRAKPKSFLSHRLPECSCSTVKNADFQKGTKLQTLYSVQESCHSGLEQNPTTVISQESTGDDNETEEDENDTDVQEPDDNSQVNTVPSVEEDEEMDPGD
ncbi:O-fucosyltransferase family protein [Striga asiatica]|uniref:O-fucosyltransferase family protein n=1 Tax=Striga asiatica TaxID=4170 RepID=A0A5A7QVP5_STRAF|nr:O-fucosyltransferase family protein [Striga asiatica]